MAKAKYVNEFQAAYEQSEQYNLMLRHALLAKNEANKALRAQLAELEAIAKVGAHAPQPKQPRPPRVVPPDELARVEAMRVAKEAAMRGGRAVLVHVN